MENDVAELKERVLLCPGCPWSDRKSRTVPFEGPTDAEVMFVGRNPGEQEDRTGIPFYSKAPGGGRFNDLLEWVGIPRSRIWVTNTAKCQGKTPTERDPAPPPEIYNHCVHWVFEEMLFLKKTLKVVVTLGNDAMFYVAKQQGSCLHDEGRVHKPDPDGPLFFIMSHPGLWLRRRSHLTVVREQVAPKLRRLLLGLGVKGLTNPADHDLTELLK